MKLLIVLSLFAVTAAGLAPGAAHAIAGKPSVLCATDDEVYAKVGSQHLVIQYDDLDSVIGPSRGDRVIEVSQYDPSPLLVDPCSAEDVLLPPQSGWLWYPFGRY